MKRYLLPIIIECMEEGGYYAECPLLQGCHVEGETYAEAIENLQDAINIIFKSYKELGKKLPEMPSYSKNIIVTSSIPLPAPI